jgi:hypothetical protein
MATQRERDASDPGADDAYTLDGSCRCVIDTNVLLELYSVHDLTTLYTAEHGRHGDGAEHLASVVYRRRRAAYALALAIALHEKAQTTFQLGGESLRILEKRVPPDSDSLELAYVQLFLYYIKDYCLTDWNSVTDANIDAGAIGDACDDILLNVARVNTLPLITNEGNNVEGVDDSHGLRKRAIDSGVRVYTPREYLAELGVAFPAASMRFAERFHQNQDRYIATREHNDADAVREHLSFIGKVYSWCFDATAGDR